MYVYIYVYMYMSACVCLYLHMYITYLNIKEVYISPQHVYGFMTLNIK
jgi:hypothetical protein